MAEQTLTIKLTPPDGYEFTGEFRPPKTVEFFWSEPNNVAELASHDYATRRWILRPKPKTKKKGFINVYPGFFNTLHPTRDMADKVALFDRFACVEIEYEF